jgi:hypothetical protein
MAFGTGLLLTGCSAFKDLPKYQFQDDKLIQPGKQPVRASVYVTAD